MIFCYCYLPSATPGWAGTDLVHIQYILFFLFHLLRVLETSFLTFSSSSVLLTRFSKSKGSVFLGARCTFSINHSIPQIIFVLATVDGICNRKETKRQREVANKSSGLLLNCIQYIGFVRCCYLPLDLSVSIYQIFPLNISAKVVLSKNTYVHLPQHLLVQCTNPTSG